MKTKLVSSQFKEIFAAFEVGVEKKFISSLILVIGAWFIIRPYFGIWHDAVLYTGQVLLDTYPEIFSNDLFFAFGSQNEFTIYSKVMALVFDRFPIGTSTILIFLVALLAFWWAMFLLFRNFLSQAELLLGFVVLAVAPHVYGANQLFAFAEPFLTARSIAEPLVILALAAYVNRNFVVCFCLMVVAVAFHPIIALPGVLIIWLTEVQKDYRKIFALIPGGVFILVAAFYSIKPFDRIFITFDKEWMAAIKFAIVFMSNWDWVDWNIVLFDIVSLGFCLRYAQAELRLILRSIIVAVIAGLAGTIIGADLLNNVFFSQVQVWRSLWIAHLFVLSLLPWLGKKLFSEGKGLVLMLIVVSIICAKHEAAIAILGLAIVIDRGGAIGELLQSKYRFAVLFTSTALLIRATLATLLALSNAISTHSVDGISSALMYLSTPLLAAVFVIGLLQFVVIFNKAGAFLLAIIVLLGGLLSWDKRSDWQKYIESAKDDSHPFATKISLSDQVYWENGLVPVWLLLNRASYFSDNQASGMVFNKGTAVEFSRRRKYFEEFRMAKETCKGLGAVNNNANGCVVDKKVVYKLCVDASDLSYIILTENVGEWADLNWGFVEEPKGVKKYYLHDCKFIRMQRI